MAAAVLVVAWYRGSLGSLAPWLFILACPLLHLFMMGGHGGHGHGETGEKKEKE